MSETTSEPNGKQQQPIESIRQEIEERRFQAMRKHPVSEAKAAREYLAQATGRYRRLG